MYDQDQRKLIQDLESWKGEYRKDKSAVWVVVTLSDDNIFFFKDYEDWYAVMDRVSDKGLSVKEVGLRYRSNVYRHKIDGDGVYLIRSALGSPGVETLETMTIGTVLGDAVFKTIVQLPALVVMDSYEDGTENCASEAILRW